MISYFGCYNFIEKISKFYMKYLNKYQFFLFRNKTIKSFNNMSNNNKSSFRILCSSPSSDKGYGKVQIQCDNVTDVTDVTNVTDMTNVTNVTDVTDVTDVQPPIQPKQESQWAPVRGPEKAVGPSRVDASGRAGLTRESRINPFNELSTALSVGAYSDEGISQRSIETSLILAGLKLTAENISDQSSEQNKELLKILTKSQEEISILKEELLEASRRQSELLSQIETLTKQIAKSNAEKERMEAAKTAQRTKTRARKRKPLKDPFTLDDLKNVLQIIRHKYQDEALRSRYVLCICLLYAFGIRVNELRQIYVSHLIQFMKGSPLYLEIGKTKIKSKLEIASARGTREFLSKHASTELDYCFTKLSQNNLIVPVSREHLTRELNSMISNYGRSVNKTLVSHSCRVSFITRVCKNSGIEAARAMVGHP